MDKQDVVILGAGAGGLAAGWFLARTGRFQVTVLERASFIGGHCASFQHDGFILDHGPHKLYSAIPGILDEIHSLLSDRLLTHQKRNRIQLNGHLLDYPLRMSNLAAALGLARFAKLGASYAWALVKQWGGSPQPASYQDYVIQRFGRGVYELVFAPLAWKVWGDPAEIHPEMARTRIPSAGASELIMKLLKIKKESAETNAEFFYYPRKGFGEWPNAMAREIEKHEGKILVNATILEIEKKANHIEAVRVRFPDGMMRLPCRYLISSIPLEELAKLVYGNEEPELLKTSSALRFRHLILVYLFVKRPQVLNDHWIFFPERDFIFSRLFEQKVMSPEMGPPDRTALCCDFTASEGDDLWRASDAELVLRCVEGLVKGGFLEKQEVESSLVKRSRNFYPVYDRSYVERLGAVSDALRRIDNLLTTGRIGMYNYNNSDHCADMGRFIAEKLVAGDSPPEIWEHLEKRVSTYKIVD